MFGLNEKYSRYAKIAIAVLAVVLLIIVAALKNLTKPNIAENEASAIASLETIAATITNWKTIEPSSDYFFISLPSLAEKYPSIIDSKLARGVKDGYAFVLIPLTPDQYMCLATPLSEGKTGTNIYQITEVGIVQKESPDGSWETIK